jgi:prepilin-type processing-associated H-X9-DG protein
MRCSAAGSFANSTPPNPLAGARISTYVCPSDPTPGGYPAMDAHWAPGGDTSYCANFQVFGITGSAPTTAANFQGINKATFIGDGLSNTMFIAERLAFCGTTPTASLWSRGDNCTDGWIPIFAAASTGPSYTYQMKPGKLGGATCDRTLAQTSHTGGMNTLLGDGSVRVLSPGISGQSYWAACTPNGSDAFGPDW